MSSVPGRSLSSYSSGLPYSSASLQVNRGLTQENTCGLLTTGNTFACQVCASQIKHAFVGDDLWARCHAGRARGSGATGLTAVTGVAGGAVGWRVSDLSYRKTDASLFRGGAHCSTHLCH